MMNKEMRKGINEKLPESQIYKCIHITDEQYMIKCIGEERNAKVRAEIREKEINDAYSDLLDELNIKRCGG